MLPKVLLGLGLFATLFSILIFSGKLPLPGKKDTVRGDVILWGTLPEVPMNTVIQSFNPQAKTYAVRYKYIPETDFELRLLEAIASGQGPDMIIAPHQIILSQSERILPFPTTDKNFREEFIDGASLFSSSQGILALPVSVEPMVLFYNRTLFSRRGIIKPPTYWDEIASLAPVLTRRQGGQFTESAIALGTPSVSYAKDILMTMVSQLGQVPVIQIANPEGGITLSVQANEPLTEGGDIKPLVAVNRFFTQFGDPGQNAFSWPQTQTADPTDAFIGEKLAMYIGYSGEYQSLKDRNPRGDFQMTTFPQTRGYNTFVTGMRMYGIATLRTTKNKPVSQTVAQQFASIAVAPAIAAIVGGVPPLRTYAITPGLDPVIASSMLVARGWYDTHRKESSIYASSMISDIINYRYGVNDATEIFIGRLRDLYIKK